MTGVEIAAIVVSLGVAVLVGVLVPVLIELKKTVAESGQLLAQMNRDLPSLLKEMRETTQNLNQLADYTREGVEHASVFLPAVGEVGVMVQNVRDSVSGRNGAWLTNLAGLVAGFRAASAVVKSRMSHGEGGQSNGG
ncbi:MAG: DUF948 domain-containing protein [Nitrospiraceae bacterium]